LIPLRVEELGLSIYGLGFRVEGLVSRVDRLRVSWLNGVYRESRRCSRDTYPEAYITKYTSIRRFETTPGAARNSFTVESLLCSGSDAGSYSRLIDFVYHSTDGANNFFISLALHHKSLDFGECEYKSRN